MERDFKFKFKLSNKLARRSGAALAAAGPLAASMLRSALVFLASALGAAATTLRGLASETAQEQQADLISLDLGLLVAAVGMVLLVRESNRHARGEMVAVIAAGSSPVPPSA